MPLIYLDFNRTTPTAPSVTEAMHPYWAGHYLLPGQEHADARSVAEAIEMAREGVAGLVGCDPFEIVFTSGGTEANNMAVLGTAIAREPGHIVASCLEHDSVLGPLEWLQSRGWSHDLVQCDGQGRVDPDDVADRIRSDTQLVCLQLANPVLGTIQPIREVADRCHQLGVPLHCDATQAFGKLPVDIRQLRADTLAISGHKFYGPKGIGALYVRRGFKLAPIQFGEPQEMGLRPGAANVPAMVGLGAAARLAGKCSADAQTTLGQLRERLSNALLSTLSESALVDTGNGLRLPNTLAVELPSSAREVQRRATEMVFSAARSSSPPDQMTRVLRHIGMSDLRIGRTLVFSLGWTSSHDQVDRAVELLADASERTKAG